MSFLTGTGTEVLYASTAAGLTQASFTTEQLFNTTGTMGAQFHLPPDFWPPNPSAVGRGIGIVAFGILASTATPTYTFTVRGGAAGNVASTPILAGSAAMTTISGATTAAWKFEAYCILKTLGAAGGNSTLTSVGYVDCDGLLGTGNHMLYGAAASPGTVATLDTSITNYINFNIACSASSASNTISLQSLMIFGLN